MANDDPQPAEPLLLYIGRAAQFVATLPAVYNALTEPAARAAALTAMGKALDTVTPPVAAEDVHARLIGVTDDLAAATTSGSEIDFEESAQILAAALGRLLESLEAPGDV